MNKNELVKRVVAIHSSHEDWEYQIRNLREISKLEWAIDVLETNGEYLKIRTLHGATAFDVLSYAMNITSVLIENIVRKYGTENVLVDGFLYETVYPTDKANML